MSIRAMSWVFEQEIKPASNKLVLLAFADCCNDQDHTAWPSMKTVLQMTSLDEKTITKAVRNLQEHGYLIDTGRRVGSTQMVKVYQLNGLPSDEQHYVYELRHPDTGEFYIGVRSCCSNPAIDRYMGSGAWPNKMHREKVKLVKSIVGRFASRVEAEAYECSLIDRDIEDPLCRNESRQNKHHRFSGANTTVFPVQHHRFSGATPPETGGGTVTKPLEEPQTPRDPTGLPDGFEHFWEAYPRKVGKAGAVKAFAKALKKIKMPQLMVSLERHKQSVQWVKDGGMFIPHPATWLNGERWDDAVIPAAGATTTDPVRDPDKLVIGFLTFTRAKPPRREQFDSDGKHQTYLSAWRKHFGVAV